MLDSNSTSLLAGLLAGTGDYRKAAVWLKGHVIHGYDPAVWRRDDFGSPIRYADHGNRTSDYGWEIDHIVPTALGGADEMSNLRPLRCTTNAGLGGLLGGSGLFSK